MRGLRTRLATRKTKRIWCELTDGTTVGLCPRCGERLMLIALSNGEHPVAMLNNDNHPLPAERSLKDWRTPICQQCRLDEETSAKAIEAHTWARPYALGNMPTPADSADLYARLAEHYEINRNIKNNEPHKTGDTHQ